jgi:regulator of nonsense transcripts 2
LFSTLIFVDDLAAGAAEDVDLTEDGELTTTTTTGEGTSEKSGRDGNQPASTAAVTNDDGTTNNKLFILLNEKILECINKQKTDDFIVSFCYTAGNNKNARKKLIQTIAKIPRSRPELAPNYARIIASLSRLYPDIISPLLELLRKEFYGLLKAKKQSPYIDSKIKNIRLQCELIKFRICPPIVIFKVFKALLNEFNPHSIEMLVIGLETCGRFLYLLHYTHEYMEKILDTMMRLRRAKNLDLHQQTLLESAYFVVKPPERTNLKQKMIKKRTMLEQYIRYLILEKLDDPHTSIDTTIKSLRRLPWNQSISETEPYKVDYYIMKIAIKLAKTKYITIPSLADCLSGLMKFYPNLIIQIVDRCLEEIQRSLEIPYKREIQKILGLTRLIGELYNFTAIPSSLIFDVLYHCINYGHFNQAMYSEDLQASSSAGQGSSSAGSLPIIHSGQFVFAGYPSSFNNNLPLRYYDPRILTEMDLPTDLFRTQIICELLNTTGLYYVRGNMKEKLSRYLTYFQRYLLTKQLIPLHIEFCILDTFDNLEELAKEAYLEENPTPLIPTSSSKKGKGGKGLYVPPPLTSSVQQIPTSFFSRYDNYETVQTIIAGFEQQQKNNAAAGIKEVDDDDVMVENPRSGMKNEGKRGEDDEEKEGEEEEDDEDDDEEEDESDDDEEESSDDDDEEEGDDDIPLDDEDEEDEEAAATKMLEKLRIVEEDEEFEKAFKAVVQVRKFLCFLFF